MTTINKLHHGATIITGVYGAGKTEFCVNYSLMLADESPDRCVYLSDMDVVNPYFRSREKADFLAARGVTVIGNLTNNTTNQDLPAISGNVVRAVLAKECLVVDLAGDTLGLHALSLFKRQLSDYDIWVVVNANRVESSTTGKVVEFVKRIEAVSGLKVTGLVNNTHMLRETTPKDILLGEEIAHAAATQLSVPLVYTVAQSCFAPELKDKCVAPLFLFDEMIMREPWM